ncbi:MAG TPA: dihydrofolate reductase family protein [Trebonia sp.]
MGAVVLDMSMSLDGFVAGPGPRVGVPLGDGGQRLHDWMFSGRTDPGKALEGGQAADVNGAVARELFATTGAVLMGRRIFELGIGPWADTPFPVPCFVLTHHAPEDLVMASGTFTFVTEGLAAALDRARAAAGSRNVLAHSPDIAQQLLRAGLLDEIQLHLVPILLGEGLRLFEHTGEASRELELTGMIEAPDVTHLYYRLAKQPAITSPAT